MTYVVQCKKHGSSVACTLLSHRTPPHPTNMQTSSRIDMQAQTWKQHSAHVPKLFSPCNSGLVTPRLLRTHGVARKKVQSFTTHCVAPFFLVIFHNCKNQNILTLVHPHMSSTNAWHCKLSCCHPSGQSTHRRSLDLLNAVIVIKCMWQEFSTYTWDFTIPTFQAGEQSQVICRQFRRSLHRRNKRKLRLNTQTCAFMSFLRRLAIFLACFADSRNCSLIAFLCCFRALISPRECGRAFSNSALGWEVFSVQPWWPWHRGPDRMQCVRSRVVEQKGEQSVSERSVTHFYMSFLVCFCSGDSAVFTLLNFRLRAWRPFL